MSNLMQYLIQQTHEFNERVDTVEESVTDLLDKLAVTEYNIIRQLRIVRKELKELYEEEGYEDLE